MRPELVAQANETSAPSSRGRQAVAIHARVPRWIAASAAPPRNDGNLCREWWNTRQSTASASTSTSTSTSTPASASGARNSHPEFLPRQPRFQQLPVDPLPDTRSKMRLPFPPWRGWKGAGGIGGVSRKPPPHQPDFHCARLTRHRTPETKRGKRNRRVCQENSPRLPPSAPGGAGEQPCLKSSNIWAPRCVVSQN